MKVLHRAREAAMKARCKQLRRHVTVGFVLMVLVGVVAGPAFAQSPPLLRTLFFPENAQCFGSGESTTVGTALAIAQGSKVGPGFPEYPVLLVTACDTGDGTQLHFLNPDISEGSTAERIHTMSTSVTPQSLALRGNKGDLLACVPSGGGGNLYTISPATGAATPLGAAPGIAVASCSGVAWDAATSSIWAYRNISGARRIVRMNASGVVQAPTTGFIPPCTTSTGLAIGGGSLFVACQQQTSPAVQPE